jgi:hypothetical protein
MNLKFFLNNTSGKMSVDWLSQNEIVVRFNYVPTNCSTIH